MKKSEQQLLRSLHGFIRGQKVDCVIENDSQWEELLSLAISHKVLPMVYDSLGMSDSLEMIPLKVRGIWKSAAWRELAQQIRKDNFFLDFYRQLLEQDIKCIVVKGVLCRSLYPKPDARVSSDEDLFVSERDFKRLRNVCVENHFVAIHEDDREWAFYHEESGLKLEVHKKLFDEQSRSYGDFNLPFQNSMDSAVIYDVQGVKIWSMNETDHMLYLMLHCFKHFLHSGVGIRQICDLVIFAEHFGDRIRWNYIFEELHKVKADILFMNLFDIGKRYFGFSYKKAGIPEKLRNKYKNYIDSEDLLDDFLMAGVYGTSSESRTHSSLITLNAVAASKDKKTTRGSLIRTVFPDRRYMSIDYPILKKYGFLLPVIWGIRIVRYMANLIANRKTKDNSALESIRIGNMRVDLLRKYRIISK